jgi:hypothetical protein
MQQIPFSADGRAAVTANLLMGRPKIRSLFEIGESGHDAASPSVLKLPTRCVMTSDGEPYAINSGVIFIRLLNIRRTQVHNTLYFQEAPYRI